MHGQKAHAGLRHLRDGARHGLRNVVHLQIEKDLLAFAEQLADDLHAGGGVQFQADLVEVDARADSGDQGAGGRGGFHVERDDDGVVHGFRRHMSRMAFSARGSTRPMR